MLIHQKKRFPFKLASIFVALLIIGGIAYAISSNFFGDSQPNSGPTEQDLQEQRDTELERKRQFVEETKDTETPGVNPEIPNSSDTIEISTRQDKGTVTISSKLYGYSAGNCRLTITNGSSTISETADIIYQPEYSTCAGFSIVKTRLGTGLWTITLYATPQGGAELSRTINYRAE